MQAQRNWPTTSLDSVLAFIGNGTTAEQNRDGRGVPVTRIETIADEHVDSNRVGYIENPDSELFERFRIEPGDVLFSHINSEPQIGRAVVYRGDPPILLHGMNLLRLRFITDAADPEFMVFLFRYYRQSGVFVSLASRAVGQSSINQGRLKTLKIRLPCLREQKAIVHLLRTVLEPKQVRHREVALERERKSALMEHLFTHGTRDEATKQSEIGEIPESWRVAPLGEVTKISSGGTPDRSKTEYWGGTIPWVKTGEIRYNTIVSTEERITQEGIENSAAKIFPAGTLLMAMYGQGVTRGKVAILGIDAAINQACAAITPVNGELLPMFALHYLQFAYEGIRVLGHGANQKNLNSHLVGSIPIPLPSPAEQKEISNVLTAVDTKVNSTEEESKLLDELFDTLLDKLMTGKVSIEGLINEGSKS